MYGIGTNSFFPLPVTEKLDANRICEILEKYSCYPFGIYLNESKFKAKSDVV
jgi:hypothetical protein